MKAYLVSKYKSPIQAGEVSEPTVGDRDVLVDVHAAGVNMLDAKIRDGEFKLLIPYQAPFLVGHDLAGVVARIGSAVTRFTVGDEVYARPRDGRIGTFAERIAVDEDDLAIKPANLSMAEAASVPLVALTAWQALVERAKLQPAQSVLIHAGSGGVGTYAIQLAKHLGATVTTTTGTSNVEWVRDLGADVVIDYRTQDFETVAHDYDIVLDSRGGDTLAKSLRVLNPGGTAIGIAGPPDPDFARQQGLRLPLRLAITGLSLKDAPNRAPPRRAVLVPVDARQRCATRRDHQAHRYQRPPTHHRPNISIRLGPASPRPRRKRPDQGQGRHHDGLTHSGALRSATARRSVGPSWRAHAGAHSPSKRLR
jgi:NADPH:quinone reductase-like Zn-dependent oxidoreductase